MKTKTINVVRAAGPIALLAISAIMFYSACERDDRPVYQILEPSQEEIRQPVLTGFVELVGPGGNPYADLEFYKKRESFDLDSLPPRIAQILARIVHSPEEIQVERSEREGVESWEIEARTKQDNQYDLLFLENGEILKALTSIDGVTEAPGRIFVEGDLQEINIDQIPDSVIENALFLASKNEISKSYLVLAQGGQRYLIQFGGEKDGTIISLTETGEFRSAGKIKSMLRPYKPPKIETIEEIQSNLSKYGDKYHVQSVIKRIQNFRIDPNHGFRFAVVGDTRTNLKVFQAITRSINKWNPLFVIGIGDLTLYGYSRFMDRYHLQTLEKYAKYPFLPVVGNHDVRRGSLAFEYAYGGKESRVYHFDVGKCRFVILDNIETGGAMPWNEQLNLTDKWLRKKGHQKFVFIHRPPHDVDKWAYHSMPETMSMPFVELMTEHKVDHVFCGHIHAYSTAAYNGVNYTVSGGGGASLHKHYGKRGSVHHYVIVDVLPGSIRMQLVRLMPEEE
jgi:Icc-related predicted phosphoesterase